MSEESYDDRSADWQEKHAAEVQKIHQREQKAERARERAANNGGVDSGEDNTATVDADLAGGGSAGVEATAEEQQ